MRLFLQQLLSRFLAGFSGPASLMGLFPQRSGDSVHIHGDVLVQSVLKWAQRII